MHLPCHQRLRELSRQSPRTRAFFVISCIGSPACPTMSDVAVDTGSEITSKDLKEKEVVEEAENGRDAPANGNANEENGEQEADNEADEEEEEGGEEEESDGEEEDGDEDEEADAATGKRAAEDDEDDDVDTKKQKTDEDD
ncbi:prothymosin alpha-like [Trichechus inunguis]